MLGPPVDGLDRLRNIPVNSQDEKCLSQISSWMSECAEHKECCEPTPVSLPERVIEISSDPMLAPRIISSEGQDGFYVILSHHYSGEAKIPNVSEILEDGPPATLDITAFPKEIADAIDVTRKLGYRYLWVRELCMTDNEFLEKSFRFLSIYAQAALMLTASAGPGANHGLYHDRKVLYSPALGTGKDRYFRPRALRWMENIDRSPLAGRGWNVVERMLTPRIVHFTNLQMVWECASGCSFEAAKIVDNQGSGPSINAYEKRAFQQYVRDALHRDSLEIYTKSNNASERSVTRLRSWTQSVNALSWGEFDSPSDKVPVIGKIAQMMSDHKMGDYLAGVWSNHIISGLAWGRMFSLLTPVPEYVAPTWSWASVSGPVAIDDVQPGSAVESAWILKYKPLLVSHHILLEDPSNPYGRVLEGSHIILDAACIGFKKLTDGLNTQEREFQLRPVLDHSLMFDCSCCRPRSDEVQESDSSNFNKEIEHHICVILKTSDWSEESKGDEPCLCLIMKASEKSDSFTRVGFLTVGPNCWKKPVDANGTFDALGWERRTIKMV
ncbi:HET domain protein [Penicillium sp. IBT 16267x]|nr:HET domain protein [Penicillium sp. IBT 16267x]